MLIVSEISEALEADRKGNWVEDVFKVNSMTPAAFEATVKDTFEDELADAVIRIADLAESENVDLEWHIKQKMAYNKQRSYRHGKRY